MILFFAKTDHRSIKWLEEYFMPQDGLYWFIESKESGKWIDMLLSKDFTEDQLTNEPTHALRFDTQPKALTFIGANNLGKTFIATEHEFVDDQTPNKP